MTIATGLTHREATIAIVLTDIMRHEGFEAEPYECTEDKTTIGIGFNIHNPGKCVHPDLEPYARGEKTTITLEKSKFIAEDVITRHYDDLQAGRDKGLFDSFRFCQEFTPRQAAALVNMAYQMGIPRLKGFKKMILAMNEGRWEDARDEALDSKWRRQTETRAKEVAAELLVHYGYHNYR